MARSSPSWGYGIAVASVVGGFAAASAASAAVTIVFCGNGCLCIDYATSEGSFIEVRCSGSVGNWVEELPGPGQQPPDGSGSFGGTGGTQSPPNPLPGQVLPIQVQAKLNQAKTWATPKLKKYRIPDVYPYEWVDTTCTALFQNAPLTSPPLDLLANYAIFRGGEGVSHNGQVPCDGSASAWTKCCQHDPVVYLCDSFKDLSSAAAGVIVIHELLHVAGQKEDGTIGSGPNNPPTTGQLTDVVSAACQDPQPIF